MSYPKLLVEFRKIFGTTVPSLPGWVTWPTGKWKFLSLPDDEPNLKLSNDVIHMYLPIHAVHCFALISGIECCRGWNLSVKCIFSWRDDVGISCYECYMNGLYNRASARADGTWVICPHSRQDIAFIFWPILDWRVLLLNVKENLSTASV